MEGSDEEAIDRKYQKTDSGSAKAKYSAFLNDESSCSVPTRFASKLQVCYLFY